jgi:hypothetical protein
MPLAPASLMMHTYALPLHSTPLHSRLWSHTSDTKASKLEWSTIEPDDCTVRECRITRYTQISINKWQCSFYFLGFVSTPISVFFSTPQFLWCSMCGGSQRFFFFFWGEFRPMQRIIHGKNGPNSPDFYTVKAKGDWGQKKVWISMEHQTKANKGNIWISKATQVFQSGQHTKQ